jgi:hypothetical protein
MPPFVEVLCAAFDLNDTVSSTLQVQSGAREGASLIRDEKLYFFSLIESTNIRIQCFTEITLFWKCLLEVLCFL